MTFNEVQSFLASWGLYPGNLNPATYNGYSEISQEVYRKMRVEAKETYGDNFFRFLGRVIDATDGAFYLTDDSWEDLGNSWNRFISEQ